MHAYSIESIQFKLVVLVHRVLYGSAPQNTSDRSLGCPTFRVDDHHGNQHDLTILSSRQFVARLSVQGRFRCPGQLFRTVCRLTLRLSSVVLQIIYFCTCIQASFNNCTCSIVAKKLFTLHLVTLISSEIVLLLLLLLLLPCSVLWLKAPIDWPLTRVAYHRVSSFESKNSSLDIYWINIFMS